MSKLLSHHYSQRNLTTLIENQSSYNSQYSELHIFETHKVAEKIALKFDTTIIASMLTGKKVMHLKGLPTFKFLPGESVVVPSGEKMIIDFPIATKDNPTQCLALAIDPNKINEIAQNFNRQVAIETENDDWTIDAVSSHLTNQIEVNHLIERLVFTFTQNSKSKDMILDLMIQELIVRLLQTKAKQSIISNINGYYNDTRIGTVIKYIKKHLTDRNINVDSLAKKACMSSSHFHKQFKNTLGVSPIDYVNGERIKFAKKLIFNDQQKAISDIAFLSGFNSVSYFNRQFKKIEMIAPSQYRKRIT